jgi:isochorismate hydrolase
MKKGYFNEENVDRVCRKMLSANKNLFRQKFKLDIKKSALLVVDMQNYFLNPKSHAYVPGSEVIIKGINKLISVYAKHSRPIFFTRHINTKANQALMGKWWSDVIVKGKMSELSSKVDHAKGKVILKGQYDAFYKTNLQSRLKRKGITQIVICGVITHLCCETTARSAFMRGFLPFFPVDTTATYDIDFHVGSITNLAHGFSVITTSKRILRGIDD